MTQNHSCEPNCDVRLEYCGYPNKGIPIINIYTKTDIEEGAELTFDYYDDDGDDQATGEPFLRHSTDMPVDQVCSY